MLQDFLEALQAKDQTKLSELAEANFAQKLKEKRENAPEPWFNFQRTNYDPEKVICVDKLLVKGLGVDRSTNDDQMDYSRLNNLEPEGLRQFIHKWDLGYQDYYFYSRFEEELEKLGDLDFQRDEPAEYYRLERVVRDGWHEMKNEMMAKKFRYMVHVTL